MDDSLSILLISVVVTTLGTTLVLFITKVIREKQESNFDYEGWERHQTERRLYQLEHDLKRLRKRVKPRRMVHSSGFGMTGRGNKKSRGGRECLRRF